MFKILSVVLTVVFLFVNYSEAKKIPKFNLITEEGYDFHRKDLKGKPTVLIFWGIHCHSCREELPKINKVFQQYKKNVNFYAVAVDSSNLNQIKTKRKELKFDIPLLVGTRNIVYKFRIYGVPTIYILDKNTKIYKVLFGVQDNQKIKKYLNNLLSSEKEAKN